MDEKLNNEQINEYSYSEGYEDCLYEFIEMLTNEFKVNDTSTYQGALLIINNIIIWTFLIMMQEYSKETEE